jgi:DNA modification methylase
MKAFRLAVNRSATWAEFDMELLAREFGELKALNFDLAATAFSLREIDSLTLKPDAAEDDVPPVPEVPITQPGDLWLLGDHRLLCGDSTDAASVARLMNGERAGLIATDPPYGISYDSAELHEHGVSYARIDGDHHEDEKLQAFLEKAFKVALSAIRENAAWYLWHAMLTQGFFAAAAAAAAAHVILHRQIIWSKPVLVFGRGQYHWKHELCFMGWIKGHQPPDYSDHKDVTVWEIKGVELGERRDFKHSTPKPVELFRRPILKHLTAGEIAYEPFAGSGPQFIAAELTGRRCFGLEISPAYCDVIVTRWENLTGKKATRA